MRVRQKANKIEVESYFKWVIKYILENPVQAGFAKSIFDWEFSNAKDLIDLRNGNLTDVEYVDFFFSQETI
ncbi:MAG: hypothetical protein Q7S39_02750 [Ignavibacteria bacterium]|nr:hypothetical protein [Ignavibacteria bacterium]